MGWKLKSRESWKQWLFYSLLACVVIGPLLKPGFVLTLDMVFTPKISVPVSTSNNYLFYELLRALNHLLPADVIQKIVMFAILLFSGMGMHRLVEQKAKVKKAKRGSNFKLDIVRIYGKTHVVDALKANPAVSAYFAGVLYMVNPYTYERWMAGHYLLLAGYAVFPWLLRSLFRYVNRPDWKGSVRLGLWYTVLALLSIHIFVIAIIAGFVAVIAYTISAPAKLNYLNQLLQNGAWLILGFLIVNSFWLNSVFRGTSPISEAVSRFDPRHLEAFTTAAHPHAGLLANVIGMYGFWLERFHRYALPNANPALSLPLLIILFGFVGIGIKRRFKDDRPQAATILVLGLVGFFIASGIHAPLWGEVNRWILQHVPLMKGFREPQKFSALLVVFYCYFGAYGLQVLAEKAAAKKESILNYVPTAILVLPLALVPVMPFGFAGQLKALKYPASWYSLRQRIQDDSGDYKVLFLPWHEYMSYEFSPRVIANPARSFFGDKIISGDNAEFGDVFRDTANPTSDFIEKEILAKSDESTIGTKLATKKIKYVVLAHGPDWQQYVFLANQPQLKLLSEDNSLIVYQNMEYK